jgi:hypothetical protein
MRGDSLPPLLKSSSLEDFSGVHGCRNCPFRCSFGLFSLLLSVNTPSNPYIKTSGLSYKD